VETSAPKNDFALHETQAPSILIAGGIGVTPIISFATELHRRGAAFEFHYATRSQQHCAFGPTLEAAFGDALTLSYDDVSPIDLGQIITPASADAHIYCCGPKGMIDAVRSQAEAAGFEPSHIHFELFSTPTPTAGDTAFEVEIADGRVFTIPPDQSIIDVLEAADVDVMYDCQRGDCGICQCDVLEGVPDHRELGLRRRT
jgi:vanillate O-demethylase ferredoxin subunit